MTWTSQRARVARLSQTCPPDHPALIAARSELKATRAEDYIKALVDTFPPLDAEQRSKLALLLKGAA